MAYDESVAARIRDVFEGRDDIVEKKMFGGVAFMHRGNMCCGVTDNLLMARVGPETYDRALARDHARQMDFTGRALKGFIYVDPPGFADDRQLRDWLRLCQEFTASLPEK